jgi:prepilin-type N-terminal cleavage/methylation domain-containing protein
MSKAFTLVELAIVIVIIGLLVSGVLAGQELIKQAKIRAQIKQFAEFDTGALTFKSKYGNLPGDLTIADAAKFNMGTGSSRGGNGIIEDHLGYVPNMYGYHENRLFLVHLSRSNLIKYALTNSSNYNVGENYPETQLSSYGIAAVGLKDGVYYFLGPSKKNNTVNDHTFILSSPVPSVMPSDAEGLDNKIDDGVPSTGIVRAIRITTNINTNFSNDPVTGSCIGANDQVYNQATDEPLCRLVVKSQVN